MHSSGRFSGSLVSGHADFQQRFQHLKVSCFLCFCCAFWRSKTLFRRRTTMKCYEILFFSFRDPPSTLTNQGELITALCSIAINWCFQVGLLPREEILHGNTTQKINMMQTKNPHSCEEIPLPSPSHFWGSLNWNHDILGFA